MIWTSSKLHVNFIRIAWQVHKTFLCTTHEYGLWQWPCALHLVDIQQNCHAVRMDQCMFPLYLSTERFKCHPHCFHLQQMDVHPHVPYPVCNPRPTHTHKHNPGVWVRFDCDLGNRWVNVNDIPLETFVLLRHPAKWCLKCKFTWIPYWTDFSNGADEAELTSYTACPMALLVTWTPSDLKSSESQTLKLSEPSWVLESTDFWYHPSATVSMLRSWLHGLYGWHGPCGQLSEKKRRPLKLITYTLTPLALWPGLCSLLD